MPHLRLRGGYLSSEAAGHPPANTAGSVRGKTILLWSSILPPHGHTNPITGPFHKASFKSLYRKRSGAHILSVPEAPGAGAFPIQH